MSTTSATKPPVPVVVDSVATAPGDIPLVMIERRIALLADHFRHDNTIRPYTPQPHQPVTILATSGLGVNVTYAEVWYTTDGRMPDATAHRQPMTLTHTTWQPHAGYLNHWQAELPGQPAQTAVRYRIMGWHNPTPDTPPDLFATDGQGFWFDVTDETGISTFAYYVEQEPPVGPAWMDDAIIYHIFLDRYHPGTADGRWPQSGGSTDKHGGTLRGVTHTLPYLADLGITCIWLSPIGIAPSYHRYDATDYFTIDPELGTDADLRELIAQAHARQMRVILDFVPSHLSWKHPAFIAAQNDPQADTASWFVFHDWPHGYRSFLNMVPILVSLDTNDPDARQHLIDSALYWINEFGMDGYRLDHAIGHGMDFWVQFRQALQAVKPDVVTIGEVTDSADALQRYKGRLTHVLDFPLATAFRKAFATGEWNVAELDSFLTTYERFMADGPGRASFLDNHDMNRFLFTAGNEIARLKMAALCQFTLSATPIIYYGTEVGMSQPDDIHAVGSGDHHVREDMAWDTAVWDTDLLHFYQQLAALRHAETDLRNGRRQRLHLDPASQTYAYTCGEQLVVAYNLGHTAQTIPLPGPPSALLLSSGATPDLRENGLMLAPLTAVILRRTP